MTVYNGLPYLREAVESVLSQTFKDFELLVVDDASTDGSAACIRSYADPRLRLICNPKNQGQAGALNQGLSLARGEYVARLDQDDVCLPNRLRRQVDFLKARPDIAGVGSWSTCIGPDGRKIGLEPGASDLAAGNFGTFAGLLLTQATPVGHPTVMLRRRVFSEAGGYDERFAPSEDYALWTRLTLARRWLGVIPEGLVKLRIHPRQQSAEKSQIQWDKGTQAHRQFIASFCAAGEDPEELSAFLRMDEACWARFRSGPEVQRLLKTLDRVMERACRSWELSPAEEASFRNRVEWWLARGALQGALKKHLQSLSVAGTLLRRDLRILRFPSVWLAPAGFILSPFMFPALRRFLAPWAKAAKRERTRLTRIRRSGAVADLSEDFSLEQLAEAIREVRAACSELPVLAIDWMHLKQPIHPVQEKLLKDPLKGAGRADWKGQGRALLNLPWRFGVCLLYGFYLSFRLFQIRLLSRPLLTAARTLRFDVIAKTWSVEAITASPGEDFYYGDLQGRLGAHGVRMLLLCGNAKGEDWKSSPAGGPAAGSSFRLPEGCLVPLWAPLKMPFLQARSSLRLLRLAPGMQRPLSGRVALLAARDCLNRQNMSPGLTYWMGRNSVRLWRPKTFLTLYEGYGWEQCVWAGVKQADPACKTVGFQHTVLFRHNLELLHPLMENLAHARPDLVLCSGPGTATLLRASHTRSELLVFGTFRKAPDAQTLHRPNPGKGTVLVLPEGYPQECRLLFNSALRAARRLPDIRFVFRCHPVLPFEKIRSLLDQDPDCLPNVELSRRRSIAEDFTAASALLYRGSSSVLYAILYGLKPIYLHPDRYREIDPLFELTVWKEKVRSSEELTETLRRVQAAGPEAAEKNWLEALNYVKNYVRPVDEESIERFIASAGMKA